MTGFEVLLCTVIALVSAPGAQASPAKPLRLVTDIYQGPFEGKAPGSSIEVLKHVFAAMRQEVSFEFMPSNRAWMMIRRGDRDAMLGVVRTKEREQICSFPDEPLMHDKWVVFVRAADAGRLKFSSFADFAGHNVAVSQPVPPGSADHPGVPPDLWQFLQEHHNVVETDGNTESLRMLEAGRVDYAVAGLLLGERVIQTDGLSGKIEPLLSRSVVEQDISVFFAKGRVSPAFVAAFSRALKQFKETDTFQVISHKYMR